MPDRVGADRIHNLSPIYLSGPMSGKPGFNYAVFNDAAEALRSMGLEVLNPAEHFGGNTDHPDGRPAFMRADIEDLLRARSVAVLRGWRGSPGARLECAIAAELGLPIVDADTLQDVGPEPVLEEAARLVSKDRGNVYGHPAQDFGRTARLWSAILGVQVSPEQAIACMIALKLSRLVASPGHRDSIVDIAGYAACLDMVRR